MEVKKYIRPKLKDVASYAEFNSPATAMLMDKYEAKEIGNLDEVRVMIQAAIGKQFCRAKFFVFLKKWRIDQKRRVKMEKIERVKSVPTKTTEKPSLNNATTDPVAAVPEKVPAAPMDRRKETGSKTKEGTLQADNSTLAMPTPGKRYRVQDGLPLKEILAVKKHADGPVAMVQYTDSSFEIVPTKVLAELLSSAQMLIDYYEPRLAVLS